MTANSFRPSGSNARMAALLAAFLGWMFDGFEIGLFPVISRPALIDLLHLGTAEKALVDSEVGRWNGVIIAAFLAGAATGGVLFGWLGDRIGRVRAMSLSILTYAGFSGMGAFCTEPWHMVVVRFAAALGMGGEWSLGVALVREVWGGRSPALLAGLIGAAANAGFALVGFISLGINQLHGILASWGLADDWVKWRLLMLVGLVPALLTFIIRLFVPESEDWEAEKAKGATDGWRSEDLFGVLLGAVASLAILALWANNLSYPVRLVGTVALMSVVLVGYLYPVRKYLGRMGTGPEGAIILGRMQLGASLSGIALLGTWASMQWAPTWVGKISTDPDARAWTQIASATGAIFGGMFGAYLGAMAGRRVAYAVLSFLSLVSVQYFYRMNDGYNTHFLISAFVAGGLTASFYGWLPLYLPELFPTRVRATAQGFCFNFGRIIAAIGALQTGALMKGVFEEDYAKACSFMSLVYLAGPVLILFAPMTVARSGIFGGTSKAFPEETNQNGLET